MINLIYVVAGGALGASLRYSSTLLLKYIFPNYLLGTIFVNILGSLIIGILSNNLINKNFSEDLVKYFLIIGLLGSFTTFSAFSIEVIELLNNKKFYIAFAYIFISIFLCLFAAYIGFNIHKILS